MRLLCARCLPDQLDGSVQEAQWVCDWRQIHNATLLPPCTAVQCLRGRYMRMLQGDRQQLHEGDQPSGPGG